MSDKVDSFYKSERVLDDNYPVHLSYLYICDGVITECPLYSDHEQATVRDLKRAMNCKEVRNCNIKERMK